MKTSNILLAALLALGLAGLACNKGNKVVVTTKTMPTSPVDLKINWPVDRHGIQSMEMKTTSEIATPMSPQPMTQDMTMGMESALTVLQEPGGGKRDLELKYLSTKMDMSMAGNSMMSYDSTKPPAAGANPGAAMLGKMIGAKVLFVLADDNHVESVKGAEELEQQMTSGGGDPSGMMKGFFNGDAIKRAVDFSQFLPGKPVQAGDTWPVQLDYPMGPMGNMSMNYTFTLTSWEKRHDHWCAKMDFDGTIKSKPGETGEMAGMKGMKMNIHDGTSSGEMWFDPDLGMFVDTTMSMDMKMDITMPNPMGKAGGGAKDMTMQDTTHQDITTKFRLE